MVETCLFHRMAGNRSGNPRSVALAVVNSYFTIGPSLMLPDLVDHVVDVALSNCTKLGRRAFASGHRGATFSEGLH